MVAERLALYGLDKLYLRFFKASTTLNRIQFVERRNKWCSVWWL